MAKLQQFIISWGWHAKQEVIWVESLGIADSIAVCRSFKAGLTRDELQDTWAAPYNTELAWELDLLPYEGIPLWIELQREREWA